MSIIGQINILSSEKSRTGPRLTTIKTRIYHVHGDEGSVKGEPGGRQAAAPLADELQDVLTLCAVIGLQGRHHSQPGEGRGRPQRASFLRKLLLWFPIEICVSGSGSDGRNGAAVLVLTLVAMRNRFQSSLLAAAEDRSTWFLRTG